MRSLETFYRDRHTSGEAISILYPLVLSSYFPSSLDATVFYLHNKELLKLWYQTSWETLLVSINIVKLLVG